MSKIGKLLAILLTIILGQIQDIYAQEDTLFNKNEINNNDDKKFERERFSLNVGSFMTYNSSGFTVSSKQLGLGMVIDLEDALGLETSTLVFRGTANYRYGKRRQHSLIFDYFAINRKALKVLESELEFGDQIYPVGSEIESKYYISTIRAKYEYAFLQDNRVSLAFSAGLFIMPIRLTLKTSNIDNQATEMIAPLPVFGLRSDFLITKKLYLKQSAELLYLQYENFKGSILDLNFAIEHRTFKHFGFGLGINSNRFSVSAQGYEYPNIDFYGDITIDYTGVFLYATLYL